MYESKTTRQLLAELIETLKQIEKDLHEINVSIMVSKS
jgi:hypothetical protein